MLSLLVFGWIFAALFNVVLFAYHIKVTRLNITVRDVVAVTAMIGLNLLGSVILLFIIAKPEKAEDFFELIIYRPKSQGDESSVR